MILGTIALTFTCIFFLLVLIGLYTGNHTFTRFFALAFDMFWNVVSGGSLDMTISSRAGVATIQGKKWGRDMSWCLGKLEPNHCNLAIQGDIDRAKAVIAALEPYDTRNKS